jgi:hypothetical protein
LESFKKTIPLNGLPHHLQFLRKTEQWEISLILGNSTYCWNVDCHPFPIPKIDNQRHDPFNGRVFLCFSIGLKYGILSNRTRCWCSKAMYNCIPMVYGWYKYKRLPMGIKIAWFLMFLKMSRLSLSKIWNMLTPAFYLDDLLILTYSSFSDHIFKVEIAPCWEDT